MAGDAYFKLECSDNTEHIESRLKELYNGNKNETSLPFIDWDSIKWHTMNEHCILVSKEFPDTTIIIHKKENDWDLWENPFFKHYFKNGKHVVQKSKLVWDKPPIL